jgi:hypothetical protein
LHFDQHRSFATITELTSTPKAAALICLHSHQTEPFDPTNNNIMRTTTFLTAALLALTCTVAAVRLEIYNKSEDCSGPVKVIDTVGCTPYESRGSAKVISGGAWGCVNSDCTGFKAGAYLPKHGCFTTYPVWFSWRTFNESSPPPPPNSKRWTA